MTADAPLYSLAEIAAGASSPEAVPLSPQAVKVADLRRILQEKFPARPAPKEGYFRTGLESIDRERGLPRAAVTEICGSLGTGSLLIAALARAAHRARSFCALIDGGRSFDAFDLGQPVLKRLLWVLCDGAEQAVKAADLLLRDGNLPLILLDLQPLPAIQLRRIPASTWHRFHRVAEQGNAAFVVLTPRPMIEGARVRIAAESRWRLDAMIAPRRALIETLELKIFDRGMGKGIGGPEFVAALDRHLKAG